MSGKTTIVYHPIYLESYPTASAECAERIEAILPSLADLTKVEPKPADEEDILRVHTEQHYKDVKRGSQYEPAMMSAGGAIRASEMGMDARPVFALIRPPGHHASPNNAWGFCFYNNMAVAIERLLKLGKIEKALVLDIDLHFGDGTDNFFHGSKQVTVWNVEERKADRFIESVEQGLSESKYDIIGVSAGFDTYVRDWGGILSTSDFYTIGKMTREASDANCSGRCFAILEGGYYLPDLGKNARAFIDGMEWK